MLLHTKSTHTARDKVSDLTAAYPLNLGRPPPARAEVEECGAGSEAVEGEHHFHHRHQDEKHPQNDCGCLVNNRMTAHN